MFAKSFEQNTRGVKFKNGGSSIESLTLTLDTGNPPLERLAIALCARQGRLQELP